MSSSEYEKSRGLGNLTDKEIPESESKAGRAGSRRKSQN